jgi:hypothetical protein
VSAELVAAGAGAEDESEAEEGALEAEAAAIDPESVEETTELADAAA